MENYSLKQFNKQFSLVNFQICQYFSQFNIFNFYKLFIYNLIYKTAPSPVPSGWTNGFVAIDDKTNIYYSQSGEINSFGKLPLNVQYKPWSVVYGNGRWIVKLALGQTINGIANGIYTINSTDGTTWDGPYNTTFTSFPDTGLSFCENSGLFISGFAEGIGTSPDGITWTILVANSEPNTNFAFQTLTCLQDRCVGVLSDSETIVELPSCSATAMRRTLSGLNDIPNSFPLAGTVNTTGTPENVFIIGGEDGVVYASKVSQVWTSVGVPQEEEALFVQCREVIYADNKFFMDCESRVLVSSDAEAWTEYTYRILNSAAQLNDLTYAQEALVAFTANKFLFSSSDQGANWEQIIEFELHDDDEFVINSIQYINNQWILFGQDSWLSEDPNATTPYYEDSPDPSGGIWVQIPLVIQSFDLVSWQVYAPNFWINVATFSQTTQKYIGAGKNGIFTSTDYYTWTRVVEINGDCYVIDCDGYSQVMALCDNNSNGNIDDVVVSSNNGGLTFTLYQSPCSNIKPAGSIQDEECDELKYIANWDTFLIYGSQETGTMYTGNFHNGSNTWSKVFFPYAVNFLDVAVSNDLFVSLSHDTAFSGPASSVEYESTSIVQVYDKQHVAPPAPAFPVQGPISDDPVTSDIDRNDSSNQAATNAAIALGSIALVIFVVVAILLVVLLAFYLKTKHRVEYSNIDDNEGL